MEDATKMLEAKFQKAESDLNCLSRKLELKCQNGAQGDNRRNPTELLQKVESVKKEYKALVQEAAEIQKVQTEAMEYFRTQLPLAMELLQQLQLRTTSDGCDDDGEKIDELVSRLGIPAPTRLTSGSSSQTAADSSTDISAQHDSESMHNTVVSHSSSTADDGDGVNSASDTGGLDDAMTARAALRASSTDIVEISQEEFESVSELIRGRLKLSDVNAAYRILWKHFKDEHNNQPLLPTDMHKMGLRVTGATGKAKLKVLRALKLLTISTKEEVLLL